MTRAMVATGLFAVLVGLIIQQAEGRPGGGVGPPDFLVKWEWFDPDNATSPRLEAIPGKKVVRGQPPTEQQAYKLIAKGIVVFPDANGVVVGDKCEMWVYNSDKLIPSGYPTTPNKKYKVTVGAMAKLPPYEDVWYYPVAAITTVNDDPTGDSVPYFADQKMKVTPVIVYKFNSKDNERTTAFQDGFAEVK